MRLLPHERMHAAFDGDQIVGGAGAFPFELSVPGGSLPCDSTHFSRPAAQVIPASFGSDAAGRSPSNVRNTGAGN